VVVNYAYSSILTIRSRWSELDRYIRVVKVASCMALEAAGPITLSPEVIRPVDCTCEVAIHG